MIRFIHITYAGGFVGCVIGSVFSRLPQPVVGLIVGLFITAVMMADRIRQGASDEA